MSRDDVAQSERPPVNEDILTKTLPLQMELIRHDAHLRNFTPIRDALRASGQDADARYRQIQSRRDYVAAELKRITPRPRARTPRPSNLPWHPGLPITSHLAAARFDPGTIFPSFGFSGSVQMERALKGISVFPPGTTGVIETVALEKGGVFFGGDIAALPIEGRPTNPGTFVDQDEYFWLQNWSYLVPFPPPVVDSTLTYIFDVSVQVETDLVDHTAFGWQYVTVGETTDILTQGFVVDIGAAFPLSMVHLEGDPALPGLIRAQATVQRSFQVGAGNVVPAVAVLVGFAAELQRQGEVVFDDQDCFILTGRRDPCGDGLVDFRYDPLLPPALP